MENVMGQDPANLCRSFGYGSPTLLQAAETVELGSNLTQKVRAGNLLITLSLKIAHFKEHLQAICSGHS